MSVAEKIKTVQVQDEFRTCLVCGYDMGFQTSVVRAGAAVRVILICPECGARFDIGWTVNLPKE
ncbi:hypothetical protein KKA00_01210 [bacterium]|nr:hypothetical protein [bacterium]MBU1650811.1 hypothetical protein [bacterium]MBU1880551.1 hypothetical protein [bacterium]